MTLVTVFGCVVLLVGLITLLGAFFPEELIAEKREGIHYGLLIEAIMVILIAASLIYLDVT